MFVLILSSETCLHWRRLMWMMMMIMMMTTPRLFRKTRNKIKRLERSESLRCVASSVWERWPHGCSFRVSSTRFGFPSDAWPLIVDSRATSEVVSIGTPLYLNISKINRKSPVSSIHVSIFWFHPLFLN